MREIFDDYLTQFFKVKELRPTKVKAVAQGHTASWQKSDFWPLFCLSVRMHSGLWTESLLYMSRVVPFDFLSPFQEIYPKKLFQEETALYVKILGAGLFITLKTANSLRV